MSFTDTIRAKLLRFRDLTWSDLRSFNAWPNKSKDFDPCSAENLSSPTLRVAKATDQQGALCFCPVEQVFLVAEYDMRPGINEDQALKSGNAITTAIEDDAQRLGISKLVLCLPVDHPTGRWFDGKSENGFLARNVRPAALAGSSHAWC